jgi:hypothetical protein
MRTKTPSAVGLVQKKITVRKYKKKASRSVTKTEHPLQYDWLTYHISSHLFEAPSNSALGDR